jgi:hypothetical protein
MPSKSAKSIFDETFRQITGVPFDQAFHSPKPDEAIKGIKEQAHSKHPLFLIGTGGEQVKISEEQRKSHMLVSGATQEGKSRLLLHFIRHDIDRLKADENKLREQRKSFGLCFLDPTPDGDTAYKILDYCAKVGYNRVLLIDPYHRWTRHKVLGMNLFEEYRDTAVVKIMDIIRVLFDDDPVLTRRVNKFFPALLRTLWAAKLTLHEAENFQTVKDQPYYSLRTRILEKLLDKNFYGDPVHRRDYHTLQSAYSNSWQFEKVESTLNRLQPFFDSTLDLMFGAREQVNWDDVVADGWVVLVNLDDEAGLEPVHTKLLATAVINEINSAIKRLRRKGWDKRFYLYLDEAGEYVTPKIARILDLKQKTGLTFIMAHQRFSQFDKNVLNAVKGNTKLKMAFYFGDPADRHQIVEMFYGGKLSDRQVEYALSDQSSREAVVKLGKAPPRLIRIPDVKDAPKAPKEFINELYLNPWYLNVNDVLHDQQQRLYGEDSGLYKTRSTTTQEQRNLRNDSRRKTSKDNISPVPPPQADDSSDSDGRIRQHQSASEAWEAVSKQFEFSDGDTQTNGAEDADSSSNPKASKKRKPK